MNSEEGDTVKKSKEEMDSVSKSTGKKSMQDVGLRKFKERVTGLLCKVDSGEDNDGDQRVYDTVFVGREKSQLSWNQR